MEEEQNMVKEIRSLDSDMQTLVYENYNKFISATDTIRKVWTYYLYPCYAAKGWRIVLLQESDFHVIKSCDWSVWLFEIALNGVFLFYLERLCIYKGNFFVIHVLVIF